MTGRRTQRTARVSSQVRQAIAEAVATRLKDPRVQLVTVTDVDVSPDLSHATVRVSAMGSEDEKAEAMVGLEHARGFLRSYLARRLDLRTTPELHFVLDRGLDHARHIDRLLKELDTGDETS